MHFGKQTISQFGFPKRARMAIEHQGIDTVQKLCMMDGLEILRWRENGNTALCEIIQALLQRHIRPLWFRTVAMSLERPATKQEPEGWHQILTQCDKEESYILEAAIADMDRGGIEWVLVERGKERELWRKGGVFIPEEPR